MSTGRRQPTDIAIHVPRERDDRQTAYQDTVADIFQSTSLVRGTTTKSTTKEGKISLISIHVPRERDDHGTSRLHTAARPFQSTSLVRGTTLILDVRRAGEVISIHVPRERDDKRLFFCP